MLVTLCMATQNAIVKMLKIELLDLLHFSESNFLNRRIKHGIYCIRVFKNITVNMGFRKKNVFTEKFQTTSYNIMANSFILIY